MLFCPAGRDRSILSPAGGLLAAGLSLIGLPSLVPPATAPPSPSPPCRTLPPSLAADTATPLVLCCCPLALCVSEFCERIPCERIPLDARNVRGQRFPPPRWAVNRTVSAHMSALRVLALVPARLYSSVGQGHRSWARPAASGPPACPSSDFRATTSGMPPYSLPSEASRTRPAAAPARLHAAIPGPAAATTATLALGTLRCPFPPF